MGSDMPTWVGVPTQNALPDGHWTKTEEDGSVQSTRPSLSDFGKK